MGKKFRGQLCVYCCKLKSQTGDHVVPRSFFAVEHRANLPKAPVCDACNMRKSRLENYLSTMLLFGGKLPNSDRRLAELGPKRLAKNRKLHELVASGAERAWFRDGDSGYFVEEMLVPFDSEKLTDYMAMVARGLLWHHWKATLDEALTSAAICVTQEGEKLMDQNFLLRSASQVQGNLGSGTLVYRGAQAIDNPRVSFWKASLFGDAVFAGDPRAPFERLSKIVMVTGSRTLIESFQILAV